MRRKLYLTVITITFLLGTLHSALTFFYSKKLTASALWFLGSGLALLLYSVLNLIHVRHGGASDVRLIVRLVNVLVLVFIALSAAVIGVKGNPQVLVLVVAGTLMLVLSFSS